MQNGCNGNRCLAAESVKIFEDKIVTFLIAGVGLPWYRHELGSRKPAHFFLQSHPLKGCDLVQKTEKHLRIKQRGQEHSRHRPIKMRIMIDNSPVLAAGPGRIDQISACGQNTVNGNQTIQVDRQPRIKEHISKQNPGNCTRCPDTGITRIIPMFQIRWQAGCHQNDQIDGQIPNPTGDRARHGDKLLFHNITKLPQHKHVDSKMDPIRMDEPGGDPSVVLTRMGDFIGPVSQPVEQPVVAKALPGNEYIQNDENEGNSHVWKGLVRLVVMVRVTLQNRHSTIELFQEDNAGQLMIEGHF